MYVLFGTQAAVSATGRSRPRRRRAPRGALLLAGEEWGVLSADHGERCGDRGADEQDRGGDDAIQEPFEAMKTGERH